MLKWNIAHWIYNFPLLQSDLKLSSLFSDSSRKCCIAPRTFVVGPTQRENIAKCLHERSDLLMVVSRFVIDTIGQGGMSFYEAAKTFYHFLTKNISF